FSVAAFASPRTAILVCPRYSSTAIKHFKSRGDQDFFTCVEYSPSAERLVTGGTDGLLRVWFPHNNTCCERVLTGHMKPITHIMFNDEDKLLVSLSEDMNVRVWSEDGWMCRQSFQVLGMGHAPISSMCYNVQNNELVLANSTIGKCLGRGTDVFKKMLTSHDKPVCSALYHSIFKQVVSVCQNGVVTVWDVLSGQATMQFKVTLDQHVGLTAISFDESQRRLITMSQDGKVRLWNFNRRKTRVITFSTATLLTSTDGYIYAWSVISKGGLLGKFRAVKDEGAVVTTMSTDVSEQILLTGDSTGRIYLWDIQ
uniref:WD repeat-containing protein on Y chromosome n=1 Tax=Seriola dumerili TaxID=41447 RepID=A0A3B4U691_SERDU